MTFKFSKPTGSHKTRINAGLCFDWRKVPKSKLPADAPRKPRLFTHARDGDSFNGIERLQSIEVLYPTNVNQAYLEAICDLENLHTLRLERAINVKDLSPIQRLLKLKQLAVIDATKVADLRWAQPLGHLRSLGLENFKRVEDLEPLAGLTNLEALAVEGSMWTAMRLTSLRPLASLRNLRWLFMTNLRVTDRSLEPLHTLGKLKVLECAKFFPDEQFAQLARALPGLDCNWLDAFRS